MKRREASADLELSEKDKEKRAKVDIRQLQTHFHHEAYKRKFFDADIWRQMQAQEKAIDDLKQEHRHVTLTLSQIYSPSNLLRDNRNRMKLRSLLQIRTQNDVLIKERKALLGDLAKQVVELEKKIVKQRDTTWRELEAKSHKHLQKKIEFLEMHLNHVTVRYNNIMTRNNRLREETVSLQIQKAIYDNSYWKLERRLVRQNKLLNDAIEQATEDYEQCVGRLWLGIPSGLTPLHPDESWEWAQHHRGFARPGTPGSGQEYRALYTHKVRVLLSVCRMEDLGRISDIRDVRYRETIQYNIRLLERKCALHKETRLKNFFLSKCTDHSELKEQAKQREAFEAAERAKQSQKESYEVAYKRLLELSDGDIDDFLEDFIEKDRRFFILFGYAIRLNVRNEGLRQRIQAIQVCSWLFTSCPGEPGDPSNPVGLPGAGSGVIHPGLEVSLLPGLSPASVWRLRQDFIPSIPDGAGFHQSPPHVPVFPQDDMMAITTEREQAETTRTQVLQELEAKITETTEEANKYENKCKESSKLLAHIQSRMETLLKDMDCDTTKTVKPLGESLVPVFGRSGLPIFLCHVPGKSCPPPTHTFCDSTTQPWPPDPKDGKQWIPPLQAARGGFGQGPGAGTLRDSAPSHPGPVEDKVKEFLMRESLLRYTSIDRAQRSQSFISPLQGASSLLWVMDRAKLCPPPPDLETSDPKTGEQGVGRWDCSPIPRGCLAMLPHVLPSASPPACPAPAGL
ncbi:coiled-coil domain-containing protein 63 [Parus major]|uniref:coiled-coil domain-containing protein 63 n=1 Tax=Parus major TaxID=9157 RepID=UPI0014442271|nr:coiled-coil domain-containing protein 63 [Parus major]